MIFQKWRYDKKCRLQRRLIKSIGENDVTGTALVYTKMQPTLRPDSQASS
jgi:hypothetical protein